MTEFETNYLAHHGIKGQKWGIRNYQNPDGTLTNKGRKRYGVGKPRSKVNELKKSVSATVKSIKKRKEEKKAAEEQASKDKLMQYLRKHPKKLAKHAKELSKDDINELVTQISFDRKLNEIKDAEVQAGWKKVQNLSTNAKTISDFITNGKNLYNNTADVYNTLIDAGVIKGKNKMIKVGEQKKDVPMSFATLLGLGTNEEILAAFDKMSTSAQNDLLKKGQNRDTLMKILGGETVTVKSSLDDIPPMIWEKVASSDPEERARGFAFLEELGVTLPK
jgi:hypothetical protein